MVRALCSRKCSLDFCDASTASKKDIKGRKDKVYVLFLSLKIFFDLDRVVLHGGDTMKDPQLVLVLRTKEANIACHLFVKMSLRNVVCMIFWCLVCSVGCFSTMACQKKYSNK